MAPWLIHSPSGCSCAGFIAILRRILGSSGLLLLTTPNSDALSAATSQEVLLPILSPGHHVILYNPTSIKTLLQRNGFDHVRVIDRGNQLIVVASAVPLSGTSACFTRALYQRYLESSVASHKLEDSLGACYAYRLLKEYVYGGRYQEATRIFCCLRNGYCQRYDLDIARPGEIVFPVTDTVSLKEFGERCPYNLCGVWYCAGLIKLLGERRPELAAPLFDAALKFGAALRRILNAIGTDDLEIAHLCRESELARLSSLAQCDAPAALRAFKQLSHNPHGLRPGTFAEQVKQARCRLFIDLVNLGHYKIAEELSGEEDLPIDDPMTSEEVAAAFAWGFYLLNDKGEFALASAVLARVCKARAESLADPDDLTMARLLQEADIAYLAALARYDPTQALDAFQQLSQNQERLDPPTAVAHLTRARERLFTDLVNLGHYVTAEEVIGPQELPSFEPIAASNFALAFATGVYLLNYKAEYAAAAAVFEQAWNAARERATDDALLWPARFHQALASQYGGDYEAAHVIAKEILDPPPGLPAVPDEYRQRLSELGGSSV
jgi:hypothetical protein